MTGVSDHPSAQTPRADGRGAVTVSDMSAPLPQDGPAPAHEVTLVDGRFMHAACSCGWRTAGRRDRRKARAEARDHALLYADGTEAAVVLPVQRDDVDLRDTEAAGA